mgnify:CR=1 FL=1
MKLWQLGLPGMRKQENNSWGLTKKKLNRQLLKLSKENDKPEYEKAADNDDIVDEIARDIRRAIENGCDYDWCFDTSKYGGFMDSYNTAIVVWGKADDIDETDY